MRVINPIAKAWANADRHHRQSERRRAFAKKRKTSAIAFLEGKHKYERTFSDKSTGEFRVMVGRDAKELNDNLFDDFLVAVQKNKKGRSLERWKVVERFVQDDIPLTINHVKNSTANEVFDYP